MKKLAFIIILVLATGCSDKWAKNMADKGFNQEAINEYGKAMEIYNRGIAFNKENAELYWRRGCLHARNRNHQLAIEDLTKSIAIDSLFDEGYPYWDRAISKEELGDLSGALSDFDKAVAINPEKENFYFFRGTLKYRMKDYKGAMSDFDNAIKFWDDYYLARSSRSMLRVEQKDFKGAMEDFDHLYLGNGDELDPYTALLFSYRGIAKYNTNDAAGACEDWTIAAKQNDSIAIAKIKEYCK